MKTYIGILILGIKRYTKCSRYEVNINNTYQKVKV